MKVDPRRWTGSLVILFVGVLSGWTLRPLIQRGSVAFDQDLPNGVVTFSGNGPVPTLGIPDNLDDPRLTLRQLRGIAEVSAAKDPVAAARAVATIRGTQLQEAYLAAVFTSWGERDGEAAARWAVEELDGSQRADALYGVADGWAETDPAAAGVWFLENTEGVVRTDAVWEVLEAWGRRDPKEAAAWAGSLDAPLRIEVLDGLADGWAAVDPAGAAEFAARLDGIELEGGVLGNIARQWVTRDAKAATIWAASLLREDQVEEVYDEIGGNWARLDPAAAARWATEQSDPGRARWALEGVARGWATHDPRGAAEWLVGAGSSDPEARLEMTTEVMESWLDADPVAASAWLDRRDPSPETDVALRAFSTVVSALDPPAAMAWAGKISNEASRVAHLRELGRAWIAVEGPGAVDEMKTLDLPFDPASLLDP